jgi:hypothetical protein
MDYYGGFGEIGERGREMLRAAACAKSWATALEQNPPKRMRSDTAELNAPNSPSALSAVVCTDLLERRAKACERSKRYHWRNRAKVLAKKKAYRDANKSMLAAEWKKWADKNRTRLRHRDRVRRTENKEQHRKYVYAAHVKGRREMKDWYLTHQVLRTNLKMPADFLELKRAQLKLTRLCRKSQTTTN